MFGRLWEYIPTAAQTTILSMHDELVSLQEEVNELRARLRQDSSNSSKPPSSDPPWQKPRREKKPKSTRFAGGQPGHPGHVRPSLSPSNIDEIVHHLPEQCAHCGRTFASDDEVEQALKRHQLSELPVIKVKVTEHQMHTRSCKACGKITEAKLPPEVPKSAFGPRLQAEVVHLVANCHLSRRGLVKYAAESWGAPISLGSVHRIEQNVAQALKQPYHEALETVKAASIRYVDETGWPQKNKIGWLWSAGCAVATVFTIACNRGQQVFVELLGDAVQQGFFVSDRYRAYRVVNMERRGVCHAHLKRDFAKLEEREGFAHLIGSGLRFQHTLMFEQVHRFHSGELSATELQECLEPIKERMRGLLESGRDASDKKLAGMCTDILRHWPALWTFVSVPGMEPTNNAAERSLRQAVLWRKGSFGTQSMAGSRFVERLLTVTHTCRQNRRNVLDYLISAVNAALLGEVAPKLIPAIPDG
jgi:transposase